MRPVLPPDLPPHAFLTPEEAADLLNVKLRWMRDAIEDRRVPHYKVGRLVRIQVADLADFLACCRVEPGARPRHRTELPRSGPRPGLLHPAPSNAPASVSASRRRAQPDPPPARPSSSAMTSNCPRAPSAPMPGPDPAY